VKALDIQKKLDIIDENLKTLRVKGTTRIDWNCLTHQERALFDKVNNLKETYAPRYPPDDVLQENHALFLKGIELIMRRAIDLFQEATKAYCVVEDQNESFFDFVFNLRVYWFLYEMQRHFEINRAEEELLNQYKDAEEFEKAHQEYVQALEDKTALWSKESFENFTTPFFDALHKNKAKGGKL